MADVAAGLLGRCTFPPGATAVTCGVSGGADSLALLALATEAGLDVEAVHVDHGLRPSSAAEADVVRAAAVEVGAAFRSVRAHVPHGPDLESRARAARHAALPAGALLGHTADDQAETVLLALVRGSGPEGLAAMTTDRHPLLGLRRHETEAVCAERGWVPVVDESNRDPRFRRNRIRHELLPLLGDIGERDPVPLLCRLADLARADTEHLQATAAAIDPTDGRALGALDEPVARYAVRAWLRPHLAGHPPTAAAVARVLAVARGEARACDVGGGVRVARRSGVLRVETADGPGAGGGPSGTDS